MAVGVMDLSSITLLPVGSSFNKTTLESGKGPLEGKYTLYFEF